MTAREYMERYRQAQDRADRLKAEYDAIIDEYGDAKTATYTEIRHAGINKPTERKVEKAQALLEKWAAAELQALEIRQNTFALIEALPLDESAIMYDRYIKLMIWDHIAAAEGCSIRQAHRLHQHALQLLQETIDNGTM